MAEGPNRLVFAIMREAADLVFGSGQAARPVEAYTDPALFLESGTHIWRMLLATQVAPERMRAIARVVPDLGSIPFQAPRLLAKQAHREVAALDIMATSKSNISGYLQPPTARIRCYDAPGQRFLSSELHEQNHIDVHLDEHGQLEKANLFVGRNPNPHMLCVDMHEVMVMMVETIGSVREMRAMEAELEKITAGGGDL